MPESYLACRSMMHAWDETDGRFTVVDTGVETARRARGGQVVFAERILTCIRCEMRRSDAYQMTTYRGHTALKKIACTYFPPENYWVKGAGRLGKDLVLGVKFDRDIEEAARPTRRKRR